MGVRFSKGNIKKFLVISILLAVCLFGGVYYFKRYSDNERREQIIAAINNDKQGSDSQSKASELNNKNSPSEGVDTEERNNARSPENLPETGIDSNILRWFSVFLLVNAIVGYLSSRRALLSIFD